MSCQDDPSQRSRYEARGVSSSTLLPGCDQDARARLANRSPPAAIGWGGDHPFDDLAGDPTTDAASLREAAQPLHYAFGSRRSGGTGIYHAHLYIECPSRIAVRTMLRFRAGLWAARNSRASVLSNGRGDVTAPTLRKRVGPAGAVGQHRDDHGADRPIGNLVVSRSSASRGLLGHSLPNRGLCHELCRLPHRSGAGLLRPTPRVARTHDERNVPRCVP